MSEPAPVPSPEPSVDPGELRRLARLVRVSLVANLLLGVLNAGTLYALVVLFVDEPADVDGLSPEDVSIAETNAREMDPRKEMREFFERMADLLDQAARRHGTNPADVLPSQAEIDAAVETRTMHSETSQAVMEKFKQGFDFYDLEWPSVIPER
ncbi:MAG: hypothetical protein RLZZ299_556 [Pseudomonadota bacterium]|jgi:hypothetical protein